MTQRERLARLTENVRLAQVLLACSPDDSYVKGYRDALTDVLRDLEGKQK